MKGMILSAGLGTRLKPLTEYVPKPLFQVLNTNLLENNIRLLHKHNIKDITVNVHHLGNQIIKFLGQNPKLKINISIEDSILGTGGGIGKAAPFFKNDDVLIINSDIICNFNLDEIIEFHIYNKNAASLGLYNFPEINSVKLDSDNNIINLTSKDKNNNFTFTGISVVTEEIYSQLPSDSFFNIIELYNNIINNNKKKIKGYIFKNGFWNDMGNIQSYYSFHKYIFSSKEKILIKQPPFSDYFSGHNSNISGNTILNGFNSIGNDCKIENTVLENCIVWDNVSLKNCNYKNRIISEKFNYSI